VRLPTQRDLPARAPFLRGSITFRSSKDTVAQTTQNLIPAQKSASSSILTMMRRLGDCPGQPAPAKET
jgi:hypothetical protein